ncbi:hypothetical protein [Pseudodesulfovibrio pelocollis]|uniref:hypothetical protein n=1 Tax=Pseudodesulfovibrio pelocollis TaxID=3051432 RepID=UPI00255B33C7|nr:hypothetical protein [Pseudodesulfovibrio sp. SB368]
MNICCNPRLVSALVLALFLCVPAQSAKGADSQCAVSRELAERVRESAADQAEAILSRLALACDEGFPLAPFEGKVAEGLAKRVPPSVIVTTLDRKLDAFGHAAAMLRQCGLAARPDALAVLGAGIFDGVPDATLNGYVCAYADQEPGPFLWGLEMLCFLSRAGFDDALTRSVLDAGFEAGSLTRDWRYFVRVVLAARQRGVSDGAVAEAARAVLRDHGSPSDVSTRLGFTDRDLTGRSSGS